MPSIVIIGGGPAGLSAAIYAARANMQTTVLYKDGGALGKTDKIENYFGFPEALTGAELLARGRAQAERLGARLVQAEVIGFEYAENGFTVKTTDGAFPANAVILATGAPRAALPAGLAVDTRPVTAIEGEDKVARVAFTEGEPLAVDGVFIAYGTAGSSDFARKLGAQLDGNKIKTDTSMATAVPGLFAAGDCTGGLLQVAKAVSDGAQAALSAVKYLRG